MHLGRKTKRHQRYNHYFLIKAV